MVNWYKRDPHRAIEGMMGLTLEECGAYNLLIDHSYARDGHLPDDPDLIKVMLACHGNKWQAIRRHLIAKGKIRIVEGKIVANGVEKTLAEADNFAEKTSRKGRDSVEKTSRNARENSEKPNDSTRTRARLSTPTPTPTDKSRVVYAGARDLETSLRQAAGWQAEPHPGLCVTGPIQALIDAGADLELDVLPTVRAMAPRARSRSSWRFFVAAIAGTRDERIAAGTIKTNGGENGSHRKTPARNTIADGFAKVERVVDELEKRRAARDGSGQEDSLGVSRLWKGTT